MGATIVWPTVTPNLADTQLIALQKLLQLVESGGGLGGGSIQFGSGPPTQTPDEMGLDNTQSYIWYDTAGDALYAWNPASLEWVEKVA